MMLSKESIDLLKKCGMVGYPAEKILSILEIAPEDESDFLKEFKNKKSEIYRAYLHGANRTDMQIDLGLIAAAAGGDINALDVYNDRKKNRNKKANKNEDNQ